jgi:hypothetical protein
MLQKRLLSVVSVVRKTSVGRPHLTFWLGRRVAPIYTPQEPHNRSAVRFADCGVPIWEVPQE